MSRPMRVLHVSQEYPPETAWGGIGTYVGALAPALVEAGAEVHVLSVVRGQPRSHRRTGDGVFVHREPLRRPPAIGRVSRRPETWGRLSIAWAVARSARRLDTPFDVVESPEWNAEGLFLARRRNVPVVVRLHSWASQVFPYLGTRPRDARLSARLEEDLVRRADLVLGTAFQLGDAHERLGLTLPATREIPLPVTPRTAPPPSRRPLICFVGRLEARKGPETLVRALPGIVEEVPQAHLVIAGRDSQAPGVPSYATWLRHLARSLGVLDHVTVVDRRLDREAVDELQRSARVCAMPSRWESFGYVAAEALANARPVVASRVGGLPEVVDTGRTGHLVDPDDLDGWTIALTDLLENPGRAATMGEEGARTMQARFGPRRIADLTLEAYGAALARSRERGDRPGSQSPKRREVLT